MHNIKAQTQTQNGNRVTRLTEIYPLNHQSGQQFGLREVFINPTSVCMIMSDSSLKTKLTEGTLPDGLDPRVEFSKVSINDGSHGRSLIVIGTPDMIESKMKNTRQLLKG
jgi:hypothetical protein